MKKQSANKAPRKPHRVPSQKNVQYSRLVQFPQARGRTVEMVELSLDSDFHCISIRFQDETDLTFVIDPALTFRADYSRWKGGEEKVLKRWPVFRSDGI
ncbi:MAG TPA: hypothetical protein VFQ41_25085 [Candidatus Angelobacter sp.]|nr:hypothetical protein [Candidatus Angelobacter sp.]